MVWLILINTTHAVVTVAPTVPAQTPALVPLAADAQRAKVQALLDEGGNPDVARADGTTGLLWAAHWNALDAAAGLLAAGADPNLADDHGVTPLERAAENASVPMATTLLNAGANAAAVQTSGLTPLMTASHTGNVELVRLLLDHRAQVNAVTRDTNSTALLWALAAPPHKICLLYPSPSPRD